MARVTMMCLLLLTSSLQHVTSFAVHRRHSRSTDLADALRMLERQRRRIDTEENLLVPQPPYSTVGRLTMSDLEPWFQEAPAVPTSRSEDDISAAWLAKTLGLEGYGGESDMPDVQQTGEFLPDIPIQDAPVQEEPSDQELDAIFGEKTDEEGSAPVAEKREKEVMTDAQTKSDVKPSKVNTRSSDNVIVEDATSDDVKLTKDEFKALLKAVEKLQQQAIDKAEADAEEAQEVAEEVEEKVVEAREEAKAIEEEAQEEAEKEEAAEAAEEEAANRVLTPMPVSKEELDNLFEEHSEEVIPTENGEIIKTENTLRDAQGVPVGKEEAVEEVENVPGKNELSSMQNFWYLKNYLDQDGDRKKRNSKRNSFAPGLTAELAPQSLITPPDTTELIEAYVSKINQLQSELDQARLVSYLEDVENDILTDALNEATLAQVKGRINPAELSSLQDAIRVEEALQQVKTNKAQAADLADEFADEIAAELEAPLEKRGEPWKKRDDVIRSEVPVFVTGDNDDVMDDDDEDSDEASTALAQWFDKSPQRINLDDIFDTSEKDAEFLVERPDDDLIRGSDPSAVASLFSPDADECPAVQEYSTNCEFAGNTVDYEARALCNVHEMCYVCGHTLSVEQGQCDFIYRAAAAMLCEEDEECVLEAEIFLNTMKLKHRFVPYSQPICRSRCAAQFLSIV